MGILIKRFSDNARNQESQSPKAGHGYSNPFKPHLFFNVTASLNPLKRVMGILISWGGFKVPPRIWGLNPLKRVMGILIRQRQRCHSKYKRQSQSPKAGHGYSNVVNYTEFAYSYQESQSPKAGHGYSNGEKSWKASKNYPSLNPLKRVMGILMDEQMKKQILLTTSQSPKAGHGYSNRMALIGPSGSGKVSIP